MRTDDLSDELTLGLIHDVRTHARAALTHVQLLERSLGGEVSASGRSHLDTVYHAHRELNRLLERASDYVNAGRRTSHQSIPLHAALFAAAQHFPQATHLQLPADDLLNISVPQECLRVFIELIDNALKFSRGGPVTISTETDEDGVKVRVADSGMGIDEGDRDRVFRPMSRLHSSDDFAGHGFGLAICRRVAVGCGGTIELQSNPTGGLVAVVSLPFL